MRLAMLGLTSASVVDALFGDVESRHHRSVTLGRKLKSPRLIDVEMRRRMEGVLSLPVGALCDHMPLAVVALAPVPSEFSPAEFPSPDAEDTEEGGAFASTAAVVANAAQGLAPLSAHVARVTPPAHDDVQR